MDDNINVIKNLMVWFKKYNFIHIHMEIENNMFLSGEFFDVYKISRRIEGPGASLADRKLHKRVRACASLRDDLFADFDRTDPHAGDDRFFLS